LIWCAGFGEPNGIFVLEKRDSETVSELKLWRVIRPARIILVEPEVWPNLAATAHVRRIPLALVNAWRRRDYLQRQSRFEQPRSREVSVSVAAGECRGEPDEIPV